jgi:hypothetical protein
MIASFFYVFAPQPAHVIEGKDAAQELGLFATYASY